MFSHVNNTARSAFVWNVCTLRGRRNSRGCVGRRASHAFAAVFRRRTWHRPAHVTCQVIDQITDQVIDQVVDEVIDDQQAGRAGVAALQPACRYID